MKVLSRFVSSFAVAAVFTACARPPAQTAHRLNDQEILNGEKVEVRDTAASKSLVLLELLRKDGRMVGRCSGTLIGRHTVLTAAHCFDPKTLHNFYSFNVLFLNSYSVSPTRDARLGLRFVQHPEYNSEGDKKMYDHDVALAFFEGPPPVGAAPAAIETDSAKDFGSATVTVFGYGFTQNSKGVPDEDTSAFSGTLYKASMTLDSDYLFLPTVYYLASANASHVCIGDSGGPQFATVNGIATVIGVNSTVLGGRKLPDKSRDCSGTSTATKISYFAKWILGQIE